MKRILTPLFAVALLVAAPLYAAELFFWTEDTPATTNTTSTEFEWPKRSPLAEGVINIGGTFDGATVVLQQSTDDGVTWSNMKDENGNDALSCNSPCRAIITSAQIYLRLSISSAGASTSIYGSLSGPR